MKKLFFGQPLAVLFAFDQARQHVGVRITGVLPALVDERSQVREKFGDGAIARFGALRGQHRLERAENRQRPAAQRRTLAPRHAQQVADDFDGNCGGEIVDQIDVALVGHPIEQRCHKRRQSRLH